MAKVPGTSHILLASSFLKGERHLVERILTAAIKHQE
jgi:hypothetical protein